MPNVNKFSFFLKSCAIAGYAVFLWKVAITLQYASRVDPTLIALLFAESLTIVIILMAKPSKAYDASFVAAISTVAATFYFLFIELDSGFEIINRSIASVGQVLAIGWQIWAKIHLGRSFGLMPANRGIVTNGPYRIVRHPIYFGYFLNHLFFLMAHFSMGNLMLYAGVYFLQGVRIWREEALLKQDGDYKEYMIKTKYRFIPGLF